MKRATLALLLGLLGCRSGACEEFRCPPPLEVLPGGSCFAKPASGAKDVPVAIYLHGMTTDAGWALREGALLAQAARGEVAVLVPLGEKGACFWSPELAHHHCWPTTQRQQPEVRQLVQRLEGDLVEARRRLGGRVRGAPFLVGFSNGGFAAAEIAATTGMPLAGLVVLHAGAREIGWSVPTLLRAATGDEWHHPTMVKLRDRLAAAGTPARWEEREGPHLFTEEDAAAVVAFVRGGAGE